MKKKITIFSLIILFALIIVGFFFYNLYQNYRMDIEAAVALPAWPNGEIEIGVEFSSKAIRITNYSGKNLHHINICLNTVDYIYYFESFNKSAKKIIPFSKFKKVERVRFSLSENKTLQFEDIMISCDEGKFFAYNVNCHKFF